MRRTILAGAVLGILSILPATGVRAQGREFWFPVSGLQNTRLEFANLENFTARCAVQVNDEEGEVLGLFPFTINNHGCEITDSIPGLQGIYGLARPAVVVVRSTRDLVVTNGRWDGSRGWGFTVPPVDTAAGRGFVFPVSGFSHTWFEIANTEAADANVVVAIRDAEGVVRHDEAFTVPAGGYVNTRDIPALRGIYGWAKPASVTIGSSRDVVVTNGRWSSSSGWGFTVLPIDVAAGRGFHVPLCGWNETYIEMANAENLDGWVGCHVFDADGEYLDGFMADIPRRGCLRTRDIAGFRNLYDLAKPAVAYIFSNRHIVVANGRWSRSAGWGMTVPPTEEAAGRLFTFPVSGWSDAWMEIANTSAAPAEVTVGIRRRDGAPRPLGIRVTVPPNGYVRTWDILPLRDIYNYERPARVSLSSTQDVVVMNGRWSPSAGWGFYVPPR